MVQIQHNYDRLKLKNNQSLMTKRLATYLADGIYDILEEWAKDERRSVSSLSAFILEQAARERQKEMKQQPPPSDEKQEKS
ncbi:ribbon-helix-helix domain-containing protein [Microcoleus sp. K4-B3]|uniref:ribbon-helix-helix domain-containing protein n=2 Tax=unclassified Microcoleus TaxID=2642155 RepID=UPI002FD13FE4